MMSKFSLRTIFALASLTLLVPSPGGRAQDFTREAVNQPPPEEKPGERPYEMQGRKEARKPLHFEDLSGWRVSGYGGGKAVLYRSREQRMWGKHVAKITYWGETRNGRVGRPNHRPK